MKIQKGIVKYKDRNDIVCFYGVTNDGRQYYFLDETDEKKFSNGNRIASKLLVEAIDPMVKASNIGVVNEAGEEVISFDNKSIKPINNDIILVEKSQPVSQSVIAANEMRSDPAFATQLVSTPATIKSKLNVKMGSEGRYLFNDQFSEATVCDINGNNLVNNEYFSFIGMTREKLYFSKNTVDSIITEYSILPPEVQSDITPNSDKNEINVGEVDIPSDVVENALNEKQEEINVNQDEQKEESENVQGAIRTDDIVIPSIGSDDEEEKEKEEDNLETVSDKDFENEEDSQNKDKKEIDSNLEKNPLVAEDISTEVVENEKEAKELATNPDEEDEIEDVLEEQQIDFSDTDENEEIDEQEQNDEVEDNEEEVETDKGADEEIAEDNTEVEEEVEDSIDIEETIPEVVEDNEDDKESTNKEKLNLDTDKFDETDNSLEDEVSRILDNEDGEDFSMNDNDYSDIETEFEKDINDEIFKDSIFRADKIVNDFSDTFEEHDFSKISSSRRDNIMTDVAKSMANLIRQNKEQRNIINKYQEKLERINSTRRSIVDKVKVQEQKIDVLTNKIRGMEKTLNNLENRNQLLESKNRDQEKLIAAQNREIEELRPQLAGKEDLVKVLADAQVLLGEESYDYKYRDNYYDDVA
ncbi:MAG: hypothetical protein HFJ11_06355 [Bacilli bacterium]|nr:hypothetical protein [Bacilli bacterium]